MAHDTSPGFDKRAKYWRRTRRMTALLLGAWFLSTFVVIFFARELSNFTLFGWPFSFYMAAQGLIVGYLAIVGLYAVYMRRLDRWLESEGGNGK